MKFLITGGAGFIGLNIAETLIEQGEVNIIDNLSTGDYSNIEPYIKNGVNFYESSILDYDHVLEITKDVDFIFHQAALSSVSGSIKNPITSNNVNILGTLNILEAARKNKVKRSFMHHHLQSMETLTFFQKRSR